MNNTFTYNPDNPIDDISRIRLALGDNDPRPGRGVKPDGVAFTDGEINAWLSDVNHWYEAIPPMLRSLGNMYAAAARGIALSPNVDERVITIMVNLVRMSAEFREQANQWETYQPRDPVTSADQLGFDSAS